MTFFVALKDQRFVIKVLQPFERILFVPFFSYLRYSPIYSEVAVLISLSTDPGSFLWDLEAMKWFLSLPSMFAHVTKIV